MHPPPRIVQDPSCGRPRSRGCVYAGMDVRAGARMRAPFMRCFPHETSHLVQHNDTHARILTLGGGVGGCGAPPQPIPGASGDEMYPVP